MEGLTWEIPGDYNICLNKGGGNGPQTLFLGDSNMQQYGSRIGSLVSGNDKASRGVVFITAGGVPPIFGVTNANYQRSADLMKKFVEVIDQNPQIDRVVIAARWITYFNRIAGYNINGISLGESSARGVAMDELGKNIKMLVNRGKKVTVILSIPTASELDPKKIYPRSFTGKYESKKRALTKASFLKENGALLSEIASPRKRPV